MTSKEPTTKGKDTTTLGAGRRPERKSMGGAMHAHTHQPTSGRAFALLAVTALGCVCGDIGTAPLYALRE